MTTFLRWLNHQQHRDDPIGDLAQDVKRDIPKLLRWFDADTLPNPPLSRLACYLRHQFACSEALDALIGAYREWQQLGNTYRATRSDKRRPAGWLKLRFAVLQRDGFRCRLCGQSASNGAVLEVDHKVARARGGSDDESNFWTLCFDCNRGKSDRDL